jgi:hypothetical protein
MTLNYTYLIVGGGMPAADAVASIRETDRKGTIGLIAGMAVVCRPCSQRCLSSGLSHQYTRFILLRRKRKMAAVLNDRRRIRPPAGRSPEWASSIADSAMSRRRKESSALSDYNQGAIAFEPMTSSILRASDARVPLRGQEQKERGW